MEDASAEMVAYGKDTPLVCLRGLDIASNEIEIRTGF